MCGVVGLAVHHRYGKFVGITEVSDLFASSESAVASRDVYYIDGLLRDEGVEVTYVVEVFPRGYSRRDVSRDLAQTVVVPTSGWFFCPGDVEVLLDALDADDGFFGRPVLVAVDKESGTVVCDAEGFLHDPDASEIGLHVETDFEFTGVDTLFGHTSVKSEDCVIVKAEVDARCVGFSPSFASAECLPERFVGDLGFEVPESGVDGVDGGVHLALVSAFEDEVDHPLPETDDGAWVLAFDEVEESSDGLISSGGDSGDAFVGLDPKDGAAGDVLSDHAVGIADRAVHLHLVLFYAVSSDFHDCWVSLVVFC